MVLWGICVALLACVSIVKLTTCQSVDPAYPTIYGHKDSKVHFSISATLSPSLVYRPIHYMVAHPGSMTKRNLRSLNFHSNSLLLLLSGDISSNPGPVHLDSNFKLAIVNLQSITDKGPSLSKFVVDNNISNVLVTETWLKESDTKSYIKDLTPPNLQFLHKPRSITKNDGKVKRGGGVGVFAHSNSNATVLDGPKVSCFEYIIVTTKIGNRFFNIVSLYRTGELTSNFYEEFQEVLSFLFSQPQEFLIGGDFNLKPKSDPNFTEVLETCLLKQHVDFPTRLENILDLFITSADFPHVSKIYCSEAISDHFSVTVELDFKSSVVPPKVIKYRPYKKISVDNFIEDLKDSDLIKNPKSNASELYDQYHNTLSSLVDKHAPSRQITCSARPPNPWVTREAMDAKRMKRKLERCWRRTKSQGDRAKFNAQVRRCNRIMSKAKNAWYSNMIEENKHNPKKLWNSINNILHRQPETILPDCTSMSAIANSFSDYFIDKISRIMGTFTFGCYDSKLDVPARKPPNFKRFKYTTESEIRKLVKSSPDKQCELDPCPTWLVKSCLDVLASPITSIVNYSMKEGVFPTFFKQAHITPLIKKPSLPKNELKNYRPVSGLNFISKIVEKTVASKIKGQIDKYNLDNPFQSAYKSGHSTETTLLAIQNDILLDMDKGKVSALVLLDLSAAFDTIDHKLLLDRLKYWYGFKGGILKWFSSYLSGRTQSVKVQGNLLNDRSLLNGVQCWARCCFLCILVHSAN